MNMEMDIELFIAEIQSRPAFWDLRSESYSNWGEKLKAWEEISQLFEIVVSTRNSQTNIMMPISTDLDSYRIVRNKTLYLSCACVADVERRRRRRPRGAHAGE